MLALYFTVRLSFIASRAISRARASEIARTVSSTLNSRALLITFEPVFFVSQMVSKRLRTPDPEGEDEGSQDNGSDAEEGTPRKQARSNGHSVHPSRDADMDDDRGDDAQLRQPAVYQGEDDAEGSGIGEEDEGEEELRDHATSGSYTGRATEQLTTCAEAGVIESVSLVDFMCHENLSIDLGPNMNFIIGHNGSGKSAILTAITICLGGKAAISGRGSSLKNFVRNGRQQATVTIRLKNKGPDAYNHALYGDAIIIERKFGAEGGGGYIIKVSSQTISLLFPSLADMKGSRSPDSCA